jgi:DNA topoisomerase-2
MAENANPNAKAGRGGKTIEQIYQKKTQLEHILMRPDTYIGAVEEQSDKMWVFDRANKKMAYKTINYVPGLYKIFDEILVNAADNFVRDPEGMDSIKVEINQEQGFIKVWNNGKGLPIQMHKEHKIWIPEMVFGHLLTSDNYDDHEKKTTGGRNGYGAKLTNIFSSKFVVETADCTVKQKYRQKFENNMGKKHEPAMKPHNGPDYTEVTFHPDMKRFGMLRLDDDIVDFMTKRVYDIAGTSARSGKKGLKVWLNGERLPVRNFNDYAGCT